MKIQSILFCAACAVIMCIAGCKPDANVTPDPNVEYVEVSVNGATPIRYLNGSYNGSPYSYAFATRDSLPIGVSVIKGLRIWAYAQNQSTGVLSIITQLKPNAAFLADTYNSNNTFYTLVDFRNNKQVNGNQTTEDYYSVFLDSANVNSFIKIDEVKWEKSGMVKGSFNFENIKKEKLTNGIPTQIISTNNTLKGTFNLRCDN